MSALIASNGGLVATIVLASIALNFVLSGIQKALEIIKDKTASKVDNVLYDFVTKAVTVLQKIVDWGSANRK